MDLVIRAPFFCVVELFGFLYCDPIVFFVYECFYVPYYYSAEVGY